MDKKYKLHYLPQFEQDLSEVRDYIIYKLQNPSAALRLINDTEAAIKKQLNNPLAFKPYKSIRNRQNDYYRINVRNYAVFYVVIENIMECRRIIYSRRDLKNLI